VLGIRVARRDGNRRDWRDKLCKVRT
jgi:hypothetical protein